MRWCVAHHHLDWEHRNLGSIDDPNPIASAFGVCYPAQVFLIGPDGRIVAKDLQGDQIKQAVAAVPLETAMRTEWIVGRLGDADPITRRGRRIRRLLCDSRHN